MSTYSKPWLKLPASWAHYLSPYALTAYGYLYGCESLEWRSLDWNGLHFPNRLGIAGGVDKNGELINTWWKLGAGFIEVGTVTPLPQAPNSGKIIDRDVKSKTLWNKMGFPNNGSEYLYDELLSAKTIHKTPIFVNIGKNRYTPNSDAHEDYLYLVYKFSNVCDGFVVNISSPNTRDLRNLQKSQELINLLRPLKKNTNKPILVKLSPDLAESELYDALDACLQAQVDGFVLTNTTTQRSPELPYQNEGGVSGAFLKEHSLQALSRTLKHLGNDRQGKLIISVGGILTPKDAIERLDAGADLAEVYSALVFYGPNFFMDTAVKYG